MLSNTLATAHMVLVCVVLIKCVFSSVRLESTPAAVQQTLRVRGKSVRMV